MTDRFTIDGWALDPEAARLTFTYRCSRYGRFEEQVTLPGGPLTSAEADDPLLGRLAALTAMALGVSYYKCAAAPAIRCALPLGRAGRALVAALYRDGLAEFFVRNSLPYPPSQDIAYQDIAYTEEARPGAAQPSRPSQDAPGALVGFGGGKDSFVALELVRAAGIRARLASVTLSGSVAEALQAAAGEDLLLVRRRLDPRLREANAAGAYNGHVPITAINSLILALAAWRLGAGAVVMANERSADEATVMAAGNPVNHQFSKSARAESLMAAALTECGSGAPGYYSAVRPFSEVWIARAFAHMPQHHATFLSCNRNFAIAGREGLDGRWCGACAKCASTFLLLAPFLAKDRMAEIFGSNLLNNEDLYTIYMDLLGLTAQKPWDCVASIGECRALLHRLAGDPAWQASRLVPALHDAILAVTPVPRLEALWREAFKVAAPGRLPPDVAAIAPFLGKDG